MEIRRQKEVVEAFHYDMRLPNQEVETDLKVGFSPLKETIENYPKEHSIVGARLEFRYICFIWKCESDQSYPQSEN